MRSNVSVSSYSPFKFVDRVSRGLILPQYGDGSSSRDYTYIDDIVNGVVRAVDRPYQYQVFNLGKGSGTKLSDFIHLVEKYTGLKANIQVMEDQPGDVPYTCADVRKAEYLLGYRATVPFEEGIKRTVEWYKEAYPQYANLGEANHDKNLTKAPEKIDASGEVQVLESENTEPTESNADSSSAGDNVDDDDSNEFEKKGKQGKVASTVRVLDAVTASFSIPCILALF